MVEFFVQRDDAVTQSRSDANLMAITESAFVFKVLCNKVKRMSSKKRDSARTREKERQRTAKNRVTVSNDKV
jgi:hypothetical protein